MAGNTNLQADLAGAAFAPRVAGIHERLHTKNNVRNDQNFQGAERENDSITYSRTMVNELPCSGHTCNEWGYMLQ